MQLDFEISGTFLALIAQTEIGTDWVSWFRNIQWLPSGFANPGYLWLLFIPALLLYWIWGRKSGAVAVPVDHSAAKNGTPVQVLINLAESLVPLLLAIIIFLLATPLLLGKPKSKRSLTNIQFCVDTSGSMMADFGSVGNRYDGSMKAIDDFLEVRKGDAFGLTFFGNDYMHWCPLTTDGSAIRCSIPFMRPENRIPGFGGTSIAKALLACRQKLMETEKGDRMIILVSDGQSADLNPGNAKEVAARMVDQGITVFAIHIASTPPPDEIVTVTTLTGGDAFNPEDQEALQNCFAKIDNMKRAEMEKTVAEQLDNFRPFTLLGLGVIVLLVLCGFGLRYTPW